MKNDVKFDLAVDSVTDGQAKFWIQSYSSPFHGVDRKKACQTWNQQ